MHRIELEIDQRCFNLCMLTTKRSDYSNSINLKFDSFSERECCLAVLNIKFEAKYETIKGKN